MHFEEVQRNLFLKGCSISLKPQTTGSKTLFLSPPDIKKAGLVPAFLMSSAVGFEPENY